jgi:hypothetical protein
MPKSIKLALIIILALFLRLVSLHTLPPALFSDEVDIALQVRSFRQNQSDYYGNSYPVHFHSFSDWRTSLQIYSSVIVSLFTSDPVLIVRLPSVIFSVLTVIFFYLITNSLLAAFLLALSPWSIHFGRTGFEVSGMLFTILAGIYFWLKYQQYPKTIFLYLSLFFLCLSPYFYSTAKLFLLLLIPLLFFIWPKTFSKLKAKEIILLIIFGFFLLSPLVIDTIRGRSGFRFSYISIFTEPHREQITDTLRYQDILLSHPDEIGVPTPFLSFIFHSKYQLVLEKFVSNYLSSFSTTFLFLRGDTNLRQGFGSHGLLYLIDFFLIFIGLFFHFKKPTKLGTFFFIFLLLAPISFSLTRDSVSPHATRLIFMLIPLLYFSSLGLKKYSFLLPIYFIFFLIFWHQYTIHYPQISARFWHFNLKEAVLAAKDTNSPTIYFSDTSEPFLPFFLLYFPYTIPKTSNIAARITSFENSSFVGQELDNRYFFGHLNWSDLSKLPVGTLVVAPESEKNLFPTDFPIVKKIDKKYIEAETFYLLQKT